MESVTSKAGAGFALVGICIVAALWGTGSAAGAPESEPVERGRALYEIYCSNCHGSGGEGDGPTGGFLKVSPADLTRLSARNAGEFPFDEVYRTIDGRERVKGHGNRRMPIWGLSFQELDSDANQEAQVRGKILHLIEYLKTIQKDSD